MVSDLSMKQILCSIKERSFKESRYFYVFLLSESTRIAAHGGFCIQAGNAAKTRSRGYELTSQDFPVLTSPPTPT